MAQSKSHLNMYDIRQSPIYRLRGKNKLESTILVNWEAIPSLLRETNYRVWTNEKGRLIQQPINHLAQIHRRIGNLLSRIYLPDYVYSQKGRSYADNARFHTGHTPLIKTDISKFYPSITRQAIFRMFNDDFECSVDVSHRLSDICCYQQKHLPTGSPLSGRVAFFAKRHMFEEIVNLAHSAGCKITVYVDDITISGEKANKKLLGDIRMIISHHGLRTKNSKSITYHGSKPKYVTGVIVSGNDILLPNKRHLNIHRSRKNLIKYTPQEKAIALKVLIGRLQEARHVLGYEI